MRNVLDEVAASLGAVRDGSGLTAASSSASPNPAGGGSLPPSAATVEPSRDEDALQLTYLGEVGSIPGLAFYRVEKE